MTESTWHAWCPLHKVMVGLATDPKGPYPTIARFPESNMMCFCPDDKLEIRRYDGKPEEEKKP